MLAYILCCDQFSRQVYRGAGKAFSFDARALAATKHALNNKMMESFKNAEKTYILMPLMHSENPDDGRRLVQICDMLIEKNKADNNEFVSAFESVKKFGVEHLEPLDKFGRYPTRNKALGRTNTAEEEEYLKTAGGWGQ